MKFLSSLVPAKPYYPSVESIAPQLGLLAYLLFVFSPIAALLYDSLRYSLVQDDWLELVLLSERRFDLLTSSIGLSASVAVCGMIMGILIGSYLWQWRHGFRTYARWLVLLLVLVPPYVHALAWTALIYDLNAILGSVGLPGIPLYGWGVSFWILLMALCPIAIGFTLLGLELIDSELIEAACIVHPGLIGLTKVILPLASPLILAGGGFTFILALTDYSIPSLLQVNVYALEIFSEYSLSNEPSRAFLLSIPLLLITVAVLLLCQTAIKNAALKPPWRRRVREASLSWPAWFAVLQGIAITIMITQIVVLIAGLATSVGDWGNLVSSTASARNEIRFTVGISLLAGLICLPVALAVAQHLLKGRRNRELWWLLVITPLAVPAPLVGIGLVAIWNHPSLSAVYGSYLMPVLGVLARFTPLAVIILVAQLKRVDHLLIDAANILDQSQIRRWLQIQLPMLLPGLFAAGCLVFVLSAGELGATLIVAPPGQSTLTMRIFNYLHYGAGDIVAGLCLLMSIVPVLLGLAASISIFGWSRLNSQSNR